MIGPTTQFTPKARGRVYPERLIHLTCSAGLVVLLSGMIAGASLSGLLGILLLFSGCAMCEENYYRGAYRIKPWADDGTPGDRRRDQTL